MTGKLVRLPWMTISLMAMFRDLGDNGKVTLAVRPRHEVQTRRWWSLEWIGADKKPHVVDASDLQLLLRRAAEVEQMARMDSDWDDE